MKLTWFGGTTIRIHIGGEILVCDSAGAPEEVERAELNSGADRAFAFADAEIPTVDAARWRPRRAATVLEGDRFEPVAVLRAGEGVLLVDAPGEPPLLLATAPLPAMGRWGQDAVVVLFGDAEALTAAGTALLDATAPRLVALAGEAEPAFAALGQRLDGTGLVALEPGQAVEV